MGFLKKAVKRVFGSGGGGGDGIGGLSFSEQLQLSQAQHTQQMDLMRLQLDESRRVTDLQLEETRAARQEASEHNRRVFEANLSEKAQDRQDQRLQFKAQMDQSRSDSNKQFISGLAVAFAPGLNQLISRR